MNKKTSMIIAVIVIALAIILGVYYFNKQSTDSFVDLEGKGKTCVISNTQQNLLLAYADGTKTYIAVLDPKGNDVQGTCELPFENNENIYMSQGDNGDLYVNNDAGELFKFNGNHFLKIPSNLYAGNSDVRISANGSDASISMQAGSVKVDKQFTYANGYTMKNAYIYSNIKNLNSLYLYDLKDPGAEVTNSYVALRITYADIIYYAIYDAETKTLLRCITNPFESVEEPFIATFEEDKPYLVVGTQKYDINANEISANESISVDPNAVTLEFGDYDEDNKNSAVKIKTTDGQLETYLIQSGYVINSGIIVKK